MKIAVIQASSQKAKNEIIYRCTKEAVQDQGYEVINFGVFEEEEEVYSYVEIALMVSMLLESKAVDYVITGCSSGQGMMLACNNLPGVNCGYVTSPADAYLFGRINNGNAISYSLGLNFGWAGEINLRATLQELFKEPFGIGYPAKDAARKKKDTAILKQISGLTKRELIEVLPKLDQELVNKVLGRKPVIDYIMKYGSNVALLDLLRTF